MDMPQVKLDLRSKLLTDRKKAFEEQEARQAEAEKRQRQERSERLLSQSGIGSKHKKQELVFLSQHPKWLKGFTKLCEIAYAGGIAIIVGTHGNGKTQAGFELIKLFCSKGQDALYSIALKINEDIMDAMHAGQNKTATLRFEKPKLLVIDEADKKFETEFARRKFNAMISERHRYEMPTVIIGNWTLAQAQNVLGLSIVDRTNEGGGVIKFDWESFRS